MSATAPLRLDVAVFEWRRGRWNEAKALLARNVAILEAIDSPEPFHYSKTQSYYARLLFDQGSLAEADRALTASERVLGKVQDAGSEIHALNLALRADLAANNADYAAASRLYDEVLSRWGPSGHKLPEPYVMAAKGRTRMLLRTRGADAAVLASQQILDDILHLPDLQYHADAEASARADLGSALLLAHEPTQALTHLQRAFELRFRIDDPSSPELALVRHELAAADRAMGPMDHRVSR